MTEAAVRVGTMGWSYEDWRGPFYEANLAAAKMLEQYARTFSTVELDTTFYGVPRPSTLDGWQAATPPGFLFSAKAPRAITHERRLVESGDLANEFGQLLKKHLGGKLGALLLQLPPDYSAENRTAFEAFIRELTPAHKQSDALPWVVEFRHGSWAQTDVGAFLANRFVAAATTERLDLGGPLRYLRLLGIENSVNRFDAKQFDQTEAINAWAESIIAAVAEPEPGEKTAPILVYVRNFFEGHAPATIAALRARLKLPEITPPGQQQMSLF